MVREITCPTSYLRMLPIQCRPLFPTLCGPCNSLSLANSMWVWTNLSYWWGSTQSYKWVCARKLTQASYLSRIHPVHMRNPIHMIIYVLNFKRKGPSELRPSYILFIRYASFIFAEELVTKMKAQWSRDMESQKSIWPKKRWLSMIAWTAVLQHTFLFWLPFGVPTKEIA